MEESQLLYLLDLYLCCCCHYSYNTDNSSIDDDNNITNDYGMHTTNDKDEDDDDEDGNGEKKKYQINSIVSNKGAKMLVIERDNINNNGGHYDGDLKAFYIGLKVYEAGQYYTMM